VALYKLPQNAYLPRYPGAPISELIFEGQEVEYNGVPGPHMQPLDDAAKQALADYYAVNPNVTLDPTRKLSVSISDDPNAKSLDKAVLNQLDRIFSQASKQPAGPSPEVAELRGQVESLAGQVAALVAALASQHTPAPAGKKGA
jgi:hypothetical protein